MLPADWNPSLFTDGETTRCPRPPASGIQVLKAVPCRRHLTLLPIKIKRGVTRDDRTSRRRYFLRWLSRQREGWAIEARSMVKQVRVELFELLGMGQLPSVRPPSHKKFARHLCVVFKESRIEITAAMTSSVYCLSAARQAGPQHS